MTREVIVGAAAEQAVMTKLPSWRVWPIARAPPEVMLSLTTRRAIQPYDDGTVELSMKAPMSVSKPADLGQGVPNCASKADGNRRRGHNVYPGSGPLDGGNTLLPA